MFNTTGRLNALVRMGFPGMIAAFVITQLLITSVINKCLLVMEIAITASRIKQLFIALAVILVMRCLTAFNVKWGMFKI